MNPGFMIANIAGSIVKKIRVYSFKRKIQNKDAQIIFNNAFLRVNIVKDKSAKVMIKGKLELGSSMDNAPIYINLAKNASLQIDGDFIIGNGVQILVGNNGLLKIGGRKIEKESSIGNSTKIYVLNKVEIGKDFLSAFNVFITDCDWHSIEYPDGQSKVQSDTIIGDHVWVAHESSVLKGTIIGSGSIVGCRSVLSQKNYPENSFIAGTPARVIRSNYKWHFDLFRN